MARGRKPNKNKKKDKKGRVTVKYPITPKIKLNKQQLRTKKLQGKDLGEVLEESHGFKMKKSKLSPKELEAKQFKKEFNKQLNYFKFLKKCGNTASKDFKKAKVDLKKGKTETAKRVMNKYTLMNIETWVKATE